MQAVILSAGKGTRMGNLTDRTPKPLLKIEGKNLLEHKFDVLPKYITEIVLVIGHMGEHIKNYFKDSYNGIPIQYVVDTTLTGTAHALWQAKDVLEKRFLVMMGDDLYDKKSLEECSQYDFSIACKPANTEEDGSRVIINEHGEPIQFITHEKYKATHNDGGLIFTGLYSLTTDIFQYEPIKMKTKEEWSLPSTLLSAGRDHSIKIIETDFWMSVNSPHELQKAERYFLNK